MPTADQDELGVLEVGIAAAEQMYLRAERRAVLHVGHESGHQPFVAVDDDDLVGSIPADHRHDARCPDGACADDTDLRALGPFATCGGVADSNGSTGRVSRDLRWRSRARDVPGAHGEWII